MLLALDIVSAAVKACMLSSADTCRCNFATDPGTSITVSVKAMAVSNSRC